MITSATRAATTEFKSIQSVDLHEQLQWQKFEYAVGHGLHKGLLVKLPWFLNPATHYGMLNLSLLLSEAFLDFEI